MQLILRLVSRVHSLCMRTCNLCGSNLRNIRDQQSIFISIIIPYVTEALETCLLAIICFYGFIDIYIVVVLFLLVKMLKFYIYSSVLLRMIIFHSRGLFAYVVFIIRKLQIRRQGRDFPKANQCARANQRHFGNVIAIVIVLRVLARMPFMINSDRERASPPSTKISFLTFVVNKVR